MRMTREQVERTLDRMDEMVSMLESMGKTESARLLQNAIEEIDFDLEGEDLGE